MSNIKTLHVKISDDSKSILEGYMETNKLKNMDDATEQFIQENKK